MMWNKILFVTSIMALPFLQSCKKECYHKEKKICPLYECLPLSLEELITGYEKESHQCCFSQDTPSTCPQPKSGSISFKIPTQWILDTTRLFEVRIYRNSALGDEKIEIGEIMNVSLNADPEEFKILSCPQDVSEKIPLQGFASWSWCLKPKKSGCLFLCFEVDVKGKEFGRKVVSRAVGVQIEPLMGYEACSFFLKQNVAWLLPLGSLLVAALALVPQFFRCFRACKIKRIDENVQKILKKIGNDK